ncbi:MAG TPA: cation:proton antiporter [Dermatophilaceae bacterium]|nr:cation:proton antiporter [Dermatophilaceae bacterium]
MIAAVYVSLGLALLIAVLVPQLLHSSRITEPMVLVAFGMLIGLLPFADQLRLDPLKQTEVILHVTEFTVLVALMGVGLALDRPLRLRDRLSWARWSPTWRLLGIAMPLTVGGVALLAWGPLGVALPVAVLLGGALAPTDPVLASDVQVEGPTSAGEAEEIDEDDEVRFALTSEAGLNDGLAFPFVHLALALAGGAALMDWAPGWVGWDLVGRVVVGAAVGLAVGWGLVRLAFRSPVRSMRLAEVGEPLLALAALLTAYGLAELVHAYGFLAVFACAMSIRSFERDHDYHQHMHEVIERLERLLTLVVLLVLGIALTNGLLANLDWRGVVIGAALVLVIRPVAGLVALTGSGRSRLATLTQRERLVTAFFGVRGVGSLFYLAYASVEEDWAEERWLWSTVAFTIVLSVLVHGALASRAMLWQEHEPVTAAKAG